MENLLFFGVPILKHIRVVFDVNFEICFVKAKVHFRRKQLYNFSFSFPCLKGNDLRF